MMNFVDPERTESRSNIDGSAATAVSAYFKAGEAAAFFKTIRPLTPSIISGAPHGKRSQLLSVPDIVKYCGLYPEEIFNLFSM